MGNEGSVSSDSDSESKVHFETSLILSTTQIRQIRTLWKYAQQQGHTEPGRSILSSILIRAPEAERIFKGASSGRSSPAKTPDSTDYLSPPGSGVKPRRQSVDMQAHAARFNAELEFMIEHLHEPKLLERHFEELGGRHVVLHASAFSTKLWDVFATCMIEKTLEWGSKHQRNSSSQEAWGKVVLNMIHSMKTGYYDKLRLTRSPSRSPVSPRSINSMDFKALNLKEVTANGDEASKRLTSEKSTEAPITITTTSTTTPVVTTTTATAATTIITTLTTETDNNHSVSEEITVTKPASFV